MKMRQPRQIMFLIKVCFPVILLIQLGSNGFAQETKSYHQTKKLLLKMERKAGNRALKKLFEESDKRTTDLIQALYDEDEKVALNSQLVIRYLADEMMLTSLEASYEYRKKQNLQAWVSPVDMLPEALDLR